MKKVKCERCGHFGAHPTWVIGERLPRSPQENWIWNQKVMDYYTYGDYGTIVKTVDTPVTGYESFQVNLCPFCKEKNRLIIGGRRSKCDTCSKVRYGMGNNFGHVCEDCVLTEKC
jgi:hypothetical protein